MLAGPPRIAGLWDDLNPAAGGVVSFEETSHSLTVHYTDVPEFAAAGGVGANTFSDHAAALAARRIVRLRAARRPVHARLRRAQRHRRRRRLQLRRQGDVGLRAGDRPQPRSGCRSCSASSGRRSTRCSRPPTTTSTTRASTCSRRGRSATSSSRTTSPTAARLVKLPFSTDGALHGGRLRATSTSTASRPRPATSSPSRPCPARSSTRCSGSSTRPTTCSSLDDDGGAYGVGGLSRLLVRIPADGIYTVGVTTWPDFDVHRRRQRDRPLRAEHPQLHRHAAAGDRRRHRWRCR